MPAIKKSNQNRLKKTHLPNYNHWGINEKETKISLLKSTHSAERTNNYPTVKWAEEMSRRLTAREYPTDQQHIKGGLMLVLTMEMQIKTMTYHFTLNNLAKTIQRDDTKC